MNSRKDRIIKKWLKGEYSQATALAQRWVDKKPDDIDAWLMLAECFYLSNNLDDTYRALTKAKDIDCNHPMFTGWFPLQL